MNNIHTLDIFKGSSTQVFSKKVALLMGQKVMVHQVLRSFKKYEISDPLKYTRVLPTKYYTVVKYKEARPGWIVGVRYVYDGEIACDHEDYRAFFTPAKSHLTILVSPWPLEKPLYVPYVSDLLDSPSIELWKEGDPEPFSSFWGTTVSMRQRFIRSFKEEVPKFKRDSKGRFCR